MNYIAHIREKDQKVQTVKEHLLETKNLAESYGEKLKVKHLTGLAGMLHDLGKCTSQFRDYILEAASKPEIPPKRGSVDHSTAGGKLLFEYFHINNISLYKGIMAELVGNAIISHHSYLQDFLNDDLESNYLKRVRDKEITEFEISKRYFFENVISRKDFVDYAEKAAEELKVYLEKEGSENTEIQLMFLTKFIFSAVIDADRTNTRLFEEKKSSETTSNHSVLFQHYYKKLLNKITFFQTQPNANTPINLLRTEMSNQCDRFAENSSGIYTLSIPTGGGKTLASLRYALKHATKFNKKHIIFIVPYTTIIEQNAEEVRKILNDDINILEHHSNVIEDTNDNDEVQDGIMSMQQKLKLAKDNWDYPIIFTTMVQFLNVFFAKGSRNIRRLHNLSESVIIFDEVQKVPISCVSLFNLALNFLKRYGNSSILLCTATQPALDFVENKLEINSDGEIIEDLEKVIKAFKRVNIIDKATDHSFNNNSLSDFLIKKIEEVQSVLVILNTKKVVKDLYNLLKEMKNQITIYHLSTSMCAAHRNMILNEIREHLKEGNKVICISTQLIEAGVDVSFECVVRSLAGLDSIAQAAGRCNRHGEKDIQNVYVIDHVEENLDYIKEIKIGKRVAKKILIDLKMDKKNHGGNLLSKQAMERYFKEYYTELKENLNYFIHDLKKEMTSLLFSKKEKNDYYLAYCAKRRERPPLFVANSYGTAAENFQVIDNLTTSVIVPYLEGKEIISELSSESSISGITILLRRSQQYIINLYKFELDQLIKNDGLVSYREGKILVLKEGAYNKEFGLDLVNDSELDLNIF